MRASVAWVATIMLATVAARADAALAPPPIASGTPFATARAELAAAGFAPARVGSPRPACEGRRCPSPGPISCYRSLGVCRWLFVDRANNALYFVDVSGLPRRDGSLPRDEFQAIWLASRDDLEFERIEVVLPNGAHRRFIPPPPKPPPSAPPTPLCSQVPPHTLPCWVKPPAGYWAPR